MSQIQFVVVAMADDVRLTLIVRETDIQSATEKVIGWEYMKGEPGIDSVVSVRILKDAPIATVCAIYEGEDMDPE